MTAWIAGAWGVFAGAVLSLLTTFYAESGPRVGSIVLSAGVLITVLGVPALIYATGRLAESGWVGLCPWSAWLISSAVHGTKTSQGSVLLLGNGPGTAVLYVGAVMGAVAVGLVGTQIKAKPRALRGPALPVLSVRDDDPEGQ